MPNNYDLNLNLGSVKKAEGYLLQFLDTSNVDTSDISDEEVEEVNNSKTTGKRKKVKRKLPGYSYGKDSEREVTPPAGKFHLPAPPPIDYVISTVDRSILDQPAMDTETTPQTPNSRQTYRASSPFASYLSPKPLSGKKRPI